MRTNPRSPQRKDQTDRYIDSKEDILEPDRQVQILTKRLTEMDEAFSVTLHPRKTRVYSIGNDIKNYIKFKYNKLYF